MRTVLRASLRTQARRYLSAAVAIVIGVCFVVVTNALGSAARDGLTSGMDEPYLHADVVLTGLTGAQAGDVVARAQARGDGASVIGAAELPVTAAGHGTQQVMVGSISDDDRLRWQSLREGRMPDGPGQALADVNAAKSTGVRIGDRVQIGSGPRQFTVEVVGLTETPSAAVAYPLYLSWSDLSRWAAEVSVDSLAYRGDPTGLPGRIQPVPAFVSAQAQRMTNGVDVLSYVLLLFAGIALFVSVLVIANTFSILFTQRTRELALLRCIGATRSQVVRSVRTEALVLGGTASLVGVGLGMVVGHGLVAILRTAVQSTFGQVSYSPGWLLAGFALGLGATLVASWLPTRRVVQVSPLAALRPELSMSPGTVAGRGRLALGGALILLGAGALAVSVAASQVQVMLVGGGAAFTGLLVLGPVLVPAMIRWLSATTGSLLGPAGRLAASNSIRNPRRTAATTASLLIGITLTTAVLTGLSSARGAVNEKMDEQHPIDVTVTGPGLDAGLSDRLRAIRGIESALPVEGVTAEVNEEPLPLVAAPADVADVVRGPLPSPGPGEIVVPHALVPDSATVSVRNGQRVLSLVVVGGEGFGTAGLVSQETLHRLSAQPEPMAVWLRAAPGSDPEDLSGDVTAASGQAEVSSGLTNRAYVDLQLNVLTAAVLGLLAISVIIAVMGIANTLGLSVLERGREYALLRAIGLTRGQLRRMLICEAVLLCAVAAALGTAVGVTFAWIGVDVMVRSVVADAPFVLPWPHLAAVLAGSAVAGLLACLLPARRAARVMPAAGLALE